MKLKENQSIRMSRGSGAVAVTVVLLLGAIPANGQRAPAPGRGGAGRGGAGRGGPAASTNPVGSDEKAIAEGQVIFNGGCTACHGRDGGAGDRGPALGDPGRKYQRNSDDELFDAIRRGIPGTDMPATGLSEGDAWKVAAYIRGLRGTAIDAPAKGNVASGEQIFRGKGGCLECHMLNGKGGLTGPDLSNIASQRKLLSIRDALTKAEHRVATDGGRHDSAVEPLSTYRIVRIVTGDGRTIRGVLKNANSFSLQVLGFDNVLHVFSREKLREVVYEPKSLMPTDYDKRLTPDEFQDLLAFLSRQSSGSAEEPPGRFVP